MLNINEVANKTGYLSLGAGTYQRFKEVWSYTCVRKLLGATENDLFVRLGRVYSNELRHHRMAHVEEHSDTQKYTSCYLIKAVEGDSFYLYMHASFNHVIRWKFKYEYFSPVIFSYFSSPDDTTYEELLNRVCSTKAILY